MNRFLMTAASALVALCSTNAHAQWPAVASWGTVSTFARPPMPSATYTSGFYFTRFATWPSNIPPPMPPPMTNINGNELRTMTLYSTEERTFTVGLVWAFSSEIPGCGCASIPVYYVYLQTTPTGQGWNPFNTTHDQSSSNYFCCVFGDGNTTTVLVQWDMSNGSAIFSQNGSPWASPVWSSTWGLPFNAGVSTSAQFTHIDSDLTNYWGTYPQYNTGFIGATSEMGITIWGGGLGPINLVSLSGMTDTFYQNRGFGGQFQQYGPFDDYLIYGP